MGIRQVPESILIRLANAICIARKMALRSEGAPDCNQETSRYSGIMPHLLPIYKNDFVRDICKNLASHPLLGRLPDPALPNKRLPSRIRSKRSDALRVAKPAWLKEKTDS